MSRPTDRAAEHAVEDRPETLRQRWCREHLRPFGAALDERSQCREVRLWPVDARFPFLPLGQPPGDCAASDLERLCPHTACATHAQLHAVLFEAQCRRVEISGAELLQMRLVHCALRKQRKAAEGGRIGWHQQELEFDFHDETSAQRNRSAPATKPGRSCETPWSGSTRHHLGFRVNFRSASAGRCQCDKSEHQFARSRRSRVTPPSAHSRRRLCP